MSERMENPVNDDERANAKGLKVHLREVAIGPSTYRVITLRPATSVRFSTNFFHDTWHILTDPEGASMLARLLWGLAFQRQPGTLVLINGAHLVPTPFEADPGSSIALVPSGLTSVNAGVLRQVRARLCRPVPCKTVTWQTFGLPQAVVESDWRNWDYDETRRHCRSRNHEEMRRQRSREQMQRFGGVVCYSAPPEILRSQAVSIYQMQAYRRMDHHYLAEDGGHGWWRTDGEVQVFRNFRDMVSAATVARRAVLGPRAAGVVIATDEERAAVHRQAERVSFSLQASRRQRTETRQK